MNKVLITIKYCVYNTIQLCTIPYLFRMHELMCDLPESSHLRVEVGIRLRDGTSGEEAEESIIELRNG